ncbi:MAG: DUF1549 domain-containing protein, partial [Verrucomicrobiota bacterium]
MRVGYRCMYRIRSSRRAIVLASLLSALVTFSASANPASPVDFNREVRPILSNKCFSCHGPDQHERKAGLHLDTPEGAFDPRDGEPAINKADLKKSLFLERIHTDDPESIMPPPKAKKPLTEEEKTILTRWVNEGAPYQDHWAFIPPVQPHLPSVRKADWTRNAVDHFILHRLESENLEPLPEASRETLIRRVTFDLTGLPPTPSEVKSFLADPDPEAYRTLVKRLLNSRRFGERMALAWMDASRYGDTSVMHADGPRDMWPWRDWVINAYNDNLPFDRFTIEQLAGDLLPNPSLSQKIASGFNRNHATSDEGGAFPEELRVDYVVDRVQTTSNVWLALTMECSQCHDHKYDPISQKEYFQFFAYFNNTTDPGMQTRN